jgi:outer membrane usher protein FimD/PapC
VSVQNSVLAGTPITGMQWLPDTAINSHARQRPAIEGIAQGPARVDVRQGQALVYSTLVPEGPFRLEDVQPLNRQQDMDVLIHERTGEVRRFLVPIAHFSASAPAPSGLAFAIGQARSYGGYRTATPWVASLSQGVALGHDRTLGLGALASGEGYTGLGATLDQQWSTTTGAAFALALSRVDEREKAGASGTLSVRHRFGERLSLSASLAQRSPGFMDLGQSLVPVAYAGMAQRTQSLTLGGSHPLVGGYSLGYVQAFSGAASRTINLGWSRALGAVNLSARLEQDVSAARSHGRHSRHAPSSRTGFHLSVSAPLGGGSRVSGYARNAGRGTSLSGRSGDSLGYRVQAGQTQGGAQDRGADLSWQGSRARLGAGLNISSTGLRTYTGQASGAAAWHAEGLTLGPTALGDTFAIASVGDVAGARLDTPGGAVWTDHQGRALIAHVTPYREGDVRLATRTLPRNADVVSAVQSLAVGRGAVAHVAFDVQRTRRALLTVRTHTGEPPPKGSAVLSAQGQWVTAVGAKGKVYLTDIDEGALLYIQLDEGQRCRLQFTLATLQEAPTYYESVEAGCVLEEAA